jgi:hypothetical protein
MEDHKLFLSRGMENDYFVQYSVKKNRDGSNFLESSCLKYLSYDELAPFLKSSLPENFYSNPVTLFFDSDENDPIPQREKEEIGSLVNRLQINAMLKGRSIN